MTISYKSSDAPASTADLHDDEDEHNDHGPHEEVEEGEPWLVSYADMMTLLFGFFVLLYSFAAAKIDENSEDWVKVRKEVSRYFNGEASTETTTKDESSPSAKTGSESLPVLPFDARVKSLAGSLKSPEIAAQVSELLQREMARQGITLVKDAGALFSADALRNTTFINANIARESAVFSQDGLAWLRTATNQLVALKIPLQITVEASQKARPAGAANTAKGSDEFATSSARALAVLETLRRSLTEAGVPVRGNIAAMGDHASDIGGNVSMADPIVIKILYEDETKDKK